ncbi:MAG: elongation factor 4, partial [Candidatus Riflebacteria bacterium]|nr:elongation factor 4 [Candidatus Riflebacteria bacterium]
DGREYTLNLIDTPGHVDFSYEVSRSLAACEGALLIVDAAQGVEAQTIANVYLAIESGLEIIPVINKIDLPSARPDECRQQIQEVIGLPADDCLLISAKDGTGVPELLERIIEKIPHPRNRFDEPLRALVFDSHYDSYLGVVSHIRVVSGQIRNRMKVRGMSRGLSCEVVSLGVFNPKPLPVQELSCGHVGFMTGSIKDVRELRVGETITASDQPASEPLPGYKEPRPVVFCGMFPVENDGYENLREALAKLQLNDAAFHFEPDTSAALGFGFRCGFLGLLHMEIVQERLEREFDVDLVTTCPSVVYSIEMLDGSFKEVDNPSKLPPLGQYQNIHEPYVRLKVYMPNESVGPVMELVKQKRGEFRDLKYIGGNRVVATYEVPFSDIIVDFHDKLKSRSRGYASMEYELIGYRAGKLVRLDVALGGDLVDALSFIVPADNAYYKGRDLVSKLKEVIPSQLFEVAVQAVANGRTISRATVKAKRKNVLAKCYGGDITRKRKLLEKQKAGKKRMKQVGNVEIPQEAFMAILSLE